MVEIVDMQKLDNLEQYIANAAVLKKELLQMVEIKDKFAKFTYLFPTIEDKMICKAIFDTMYISEVKTRKFISRMVDGLNAMAPQNISEMIDVYNQTSVLVSERIKKQEKIANDANDNRDLVEQKQGTSEVEDKQSQKTDAFTSAGGGVFNVEIDNKKRNKNSLSEGKIAPVSKDDIDRLKNLDEQKQIAKKQADEKLREVYEKSLRERMSKKKVAEATPIIQQMRSKYDD